MAIEYDNTRDSGDDSGRHHRVSDNEDTAALEFVSELDGWDSQHMLWIARTIRSHGIAVMNVGFGGCVEPDCANAHEVAAVPWSYSIGFAERDHPELVTFGLTPERATRLFNAVRDRTAAGQPVKAGDTTRLLSKEVRFDVVPVGWILDDNIDPMGQWFRHYGVGRPYLEPPSVLQVVWCDVDGRFPDDPRCHHLVRAAQPVRGRLLGPWWDPPEAEVLRERRRRAS